MTQSDPISSFRTMRPILRSLLDNRFLLLGSAAAVLSLGAYASWARLVAAGLAPLILSVAPCAAVCALGFCSMGGKSNAVPDIKADVKTTGGGKSDCC